MIAECELEMKNNGIIIEYLSRDGLSLFNTDNVEDLKESNAKIQAQLEKLELKEFELYAQLKGTTAPAPARTGKRRARRSTEEIRQSMESRRKS